jgi:hypothetical protein
MVMRLPLTRSESKGLIMIINWFYLYLSLYRFIINYNNPPIPTSFMSVIASTSGRLHNEFVRLLFLLTHRETDPFFTSSGVQLPHSTSGLFHFHRSVVSSQIKSRVDNILPKTAVPRITLNIDDTPIVSRSHTHPSHSQTSRLLTSSLSLGVPDPRATQCM